MAIVTQEMIEGRIGSTELIRLTDDAASGSLGATAMNRCITEGEAVIMAYIAQSYTLPLALTDTITQAAVHKYLLDVVIYLLCGRRPPVPEDIIRDYQAAITWGQSIAKGDIGLSGESEVSESPSRAGKIVIDAGTRVISRDSMSGM